MRVEQGQPPQQVARLTGRGDQFMQPSGLTRAWIVVYIAS
jgi:hypothetical protein